ncbi:MAG: helix-turn-helix transcriptional regulator [Pelagimonas sp.]|jgi:phage repressor protein C with HTH and peptisase S24 domain|nr:helix-turn-helix transcriptional regulator [Pelagimonas sp.]
MSVSDRLRELISSNNMTIKDFSALIGVSKSTFEKYLFEGRAPSAEVLLAIITKLGVSSDWLLTGSGEMRLQKRSSITPQEHEAFVPIPRFDVEASAGTGSLVAGEEPLGVYTFRKSWLDRRALKQENLAVITVKGDSMEPDLFDGDRIVIDRSHTQLDDGSIYAVHFSDGLFVKRIQRLPGDRILLISSNSRYSQINLDRTDLVNDLDGGSFKIVGRVVASMHEW